MTVSTTLPATPGLIYVISAGPSVVKIGVSDDPLARLANLQTASPSRLDICYTAAVAGGDARALESAVHTALDGYRENGEWFRISPVMAVGTIASSAFHIGEQIVEIKKEHLRYAVDRARQEAAETTDLPPTKSDSRRPWLWSGLAVAAIMLIALSAYKPDAGYYTAADYIAILIMTALFWIPAYLVAKLIAFVSR